MSEVVMLRGAEPRKILQAVIEKKLPAIMSYLSKDKWHTAKVLLTNLGAVRMDAKVLPKENPCPMDIRVDQPVGISLKYEHGKFIFETKVVAFETSGDSSVASLSNHGSCSVIALAVPDRMEIIQRRSYFRVCVPKPLKVNVALWHRSPAADNKQVLPAHYWQGRLMDISAGGLQVAVDAAEQSNFRKGLFVGLRFTPMPYETPLMFDAQIRNMLPTADGKSTCLGMQIVGLEAGSGSDGREILQRLCSVVEQYYKMNQTAVRQKDIQIVSS